MDINLRKAHAVAQGALALAGELVDKIEATLVVSIYEKNVDAAIDSAKAVVVERLSDARGLYQVAYQIRDRVGVAQAKAGVERLVTELRRLDAIEKMLRGLVTDDVFRRIRGGHSGASALERELVKDQLAMLKRRIESMDKEGGGATATAVKLIDKADEDAFRKELVQIRQRKAKTGDELLAINVSTNVTVPEEGLALLQKHGLL